MYCSANYAVGYVAIMILMCFVCRLIGEIKQHAVVMTVTVLILTELYCGAPARLPLMLALDNSFWIHH